MELWGEDALLQWPGARRALIQERDAYMACTIWAAASGDLLSVAGVNYGTATSCHSLLRSRPTILRAHTFGWRLERTTLLLDSLMMARGCLLRASYSCSK